MNPRKKNKVTLDDFKIFDARAAKGIAVARALDNKTPIPYSVAVTTIKFTDFLSLMTPKRFELLRLSKAGKQSIATLAIKTQRDISSVSRDIAKLADLGLVNVIKESNPGHGVRKIVQPIAEHIEIHGTL